MCVRFRRRVDLPPGEGFPGTSAKPAALHRTDQPFVLEHQRDGDEDEVEDEHRETEALVHFPSEAGDAHDHEEQHAEQYRYAAHHANRVHFHGFSVDQTVQEPRNRKPAGRTKAQIQPIFIARLIRRLRLYVISALQFPPFL